MVAEAAKSRRSSSIDSASLKAFDSSWLKSMPDIVCPLDGLGLLRIHGDDTEEFLNRMVTCKLQPQTKQPQLCSLCNPKGRVIACFTVIYKDDDIYLQMPHELIDTVLQHLQIYVLMTKVKLSDASDDLEGIGYIGSPPKHIDDSLLLQMPGDIPRYFSYTDTSSIPEIWQQALAAGYTPATYDAWRYCGIACQIPHIYPPTIEKLTPQMLNLDLIDAVSFSKGCYPGQEVVARTHYLGKPKRRCYQFSATSNDIEIGASVYHSNHKETCGIVVDTCKLSPDNSLGLISIRTEAADIAGLYIKTQDDKSIALHIEQQQPSA